MNKSLLLIAIVAGLLYFSVATASDEAGEGSAQQAPGSEEIVAVCEDKYNSENYADENERNNLIDACINEASEKMAPAVEEG